MFSSRLFLLLCLSVVSLSACNPHRHYMAVAPGMTQDEVRETMQQRPTAFFDHGLGHVTWQYGDEYCVLFKDNAVISKNIMQPTAETTARKGKTNTSRKDKTATPPAAVCPLPRLP
jgi:hypothetical protein